MLDTTDIRSSLMTQSTMLSMIKRNFEQSDDNLKDALSLVIYQSELMDKYSRNYRLVMHISEEQLSRPSESPTYVQRVLQMRNPKMSFSYYLPIPNNCRNLPIPAKTDIY